MIFLLEMSLTLNLINMASHCWISLKESRMIITQGQVAVVNNFTSVSSTGKSCVDFIAVSMESIERFI